LSEGVCVPVFTKRWDANQPKRVVYVNWKTAWGSVVNEGKTREDIRDVTPARNAACAVLPPLTYVSYA
jgi:hypothetical protein